MESAQVQKRLWKEATQQALYEVQKAGVRIHYPDKAPFMESVGPLYERYRDQPALYGLITEIREMK